MTIRLLLITLMALLLAACGQPSDDGGGATAGDGPIMAVNYPLTWMARRIAGDALEITFPAPEDGDPAFWEPDDEAIATMQQARLILLNGADYAKWRQQVSLPERVLVDTSAAFSDRYRQLEVSTTHSHGEAGAHSHAGTDFNTWLDPALASLQAAAVTAALSDLDSGQAKAFAMRLGALQSDLAALDEEIRALQAARGLPMLASHPVYGYLAERYGWRVESLLWEPDTMPDADGWKQFEQLRGRSGAGIMLYEDEPLPEIRARLEEAGMQVVVFRPCGNRPPSGDYLSEQRANLARLRAALER